MTREECLKQLEEVYRILHEEVDLSVTDYARYEACCSIDSAIQFVKENEEREEW